MSSMDHPPVQKALNMLRAMSADEIEQQFAFERERALLIEQMELHAARAEGEAAGEAAGLQMALARLVTSGMPEDQARKILGLVDSE